MGWSQQFDQAPSCVAPVPSVDERVLVGFLDGSLVLGEFGTAGGGGFKVVSTQKLRASIRAAVFAATGQHVYAVSANRALTVFDAHTFQRVRCIVKSHDEATPSCAIALPVNAPGGQQLVTAYEDGVVKTWDLRLSQPCVHTFKEQENVINALALDRMQLLATSDDGTLACYDLKRRKLRVKSERMHSDLHAIQVAEKYVYVGTADDHIEVFKRGEYGNILERIEAGHEDDGSPCGISVIEQLRPGLLVTASSENDHLRLLHVHPTRKQPRPYARQPPTGCGIDGSTLSADGKYLVTFSMESSTLHWWPTEPMRQSAPVFKVSDAKELAKEDKKLALKASAMNGFFSGIGAEKAEEEEEDASDEDEEESEEDEEEESDEEAVRHRRNIGGFVDDEAEETGEDDEEEDELDEDEEEAAILGPTETLEDEEDDWTDDEELIRRWKKEFKDREEKKRQKLKEGDEPDEYEKDDWLADDEEEIEYEDEEEEGEDEEEEEEEPVQSKKSGQILVNGGGDHASNKQKNGKTAQKKAETVLENGNGQKLKKKVVIESDDDEEDEDTDEISSPTKQIIQKRVSQVADHMAHNLRQQREAQKKPNSPVDDAAERRLQQQLLAQSRQPQKRHHPLQKIAANPSPLSVSSPAVKRKKF